MYFFPKNNTNRVLSNEFLSILTKFYKINLLYRVLLSSFSIKIICCWWLIDILIINFIGGHWLCLCKIDSYPTWYCLLRKQWGCGVTLKRAKSVIILRDHQLLSHWITLAHDFWMKLYLLLYSINWPNFIVWLPLPREIFGNMCIVIVC